MFKNYEIKKINDEEILYLYLDLNTEFAKINKSNRKTTLNTEILKYIKNNSIDFKGKKIILIASGVFISTLLLASPLLNKETQKLNYNYTSNVLVLNEEFAPTIDLDNKSVIEETNETAKQENVSTDIQNQTNNENSTIKSDNKVNDISKNSLNNKTSNNASKKNNKTQNTVENKTKSDNSAHSQVQKQMVSIKRSNGTILYLELEEYLIGVVAAEMPASFNVEALKAQAIAARTYAMKAIKDNVILTDTVSTQVYKDNNQLKALWGNNYSTYFNKIKKAVYATEGLVMYYNNNLINAFYHSTSNGYTEDSTSVFGSCPYLKSVESSVDKNVSSYLRTITLTYEEISNKLNIPVTNLSSINIERNSSNRVSKIIIDNNIYDGVKFRSLLGLRSTDFEIVLNENNISITTYGYGHGVGMSQYGANEYAKLGWSYSKILKHYYTGITIKNY